MFCNVQKNLPLKVYLFLLTIEFPIDPNFLLILRALRAYFQLFDLKCDYFR
jgi:hypothetical protein